MEMKDVVGYEDYYAVTDDGRVWSKRFERFLAPSKRSDGYLTVTLTNDEGSRKVMVHRLVCEAFHGNAPSNNHIVDHIDADRGNPRASNLRWLTLSENTQHAVELRNIPVRPVVGFNEKGDVLYFDSVADARRAGFGGVQESLSRRKYLCKGFAFVYESEWKDIVPSVYFEQMELVRARREAQRRRNCGAKVIECRVRGTSVIDGSVVEFPNLKAAREAGYKSVAQCLRGQLATCGKRTWEALDEYAPRTNRTRRGLKGVL